MLLAYSFGRQWRQFEAEHRPDRLKPESKVKAGHSEKSAPPAAASSFAAIVDHHLFNLDRSNELPQAPPPVSPPATPPGPLPLLMGTVGISEEAYALMVSGNSRGSRLYERLKVGEALDGYTLVSVGMDQVVMKAGAAEVKVGINDRPRKASPRRRGQPRKASSPKTSPRRRPTAASSRGRTGGAATRQPARSGRATRPKDVPVGTVKDGKRLISVPTPFGEVKTWVKDKSGKSVP